MMACSHGRYDSCSHYVKLVSSVYARRLLEFTQMYYKVPMKNSIFIYIGEKKELP